MADPWLTLIGIGEDGLASLSEASRSALERAEFVFGGPRHLRLAGVDDRAREWPVPFSIAPVLALRGHRVVVLASGDPFWHGAGGSLAAALKPGDWVSHPAPSTFQLVANRLGWRMEEVICLGLHAAPLERMRPVLGPDQRLIVTLRDGAAVAEVVTWLRAEGFGRSEVHALEALGGPSERIVNIAPDRTDLEGFSAPIALAVLARGKGLPCASGLDDALFDHDGQITKRPIRALTLSALAPHPGDVVWDIGAGSGSVGIEVLLAAPRSQVHAIEADPARAARARANAERFGVAHRFHLTQAKAPDGLEELPPPGLVFVGGGASQALFDALWPRMPDGARLVANAVTLESEALFYHAQARWGGTLLRIDLAEMAPLGRRRGWEAARSVVQWSVVK